MTDGSASKHTQEVSHLLLQYDTHVDASVANKQRRGKCINAQTTEKEKTQHLST